VELLAILAIVDGRICGDARAPEGALDVGEGSRFGAGRGGGEGRVALKVDVEGRAKVGGVTVFLTFDGVVGMERVEAHIAVGIGGAFEVGKGKGVALRGSGIVGGRLAIL